MTPVAPATLAWVTPLAAIRWSRGIRRSREPVRVVPIVGGPGACRTVRRGRCTPGRGRAGRGTRRRRRFGLGRVGVGRADTFAVGGAGRCRGAGRLEERRDDRDQVRAGSVRA